jgi:hypothetical protein
MKNILLSISCIFALYIFIALILMLRNSKLKIKNIKPIKSYDLFKYEYFGLCQGPVQFDTHSYKTCTPQVFNGFQTVILDWASNKDKNNFICYYFYLGSNYLNDKDELYYSNNFWLTIFDKKLKETVGTARWSNCYKNNKRKLNKLNPALTAAKTNVPFIKTYITATSGVLEKYQNSNLLWEQVGNQRFIHIYTDGSYVNKRYEEFKQKNLLEQKVEK